MTNFRTYKVTKLSAGQSASFNISGSVTAWGVFRTSVTSGSLNLEGGGTIEIADFAAGMPFPCFFTSVSVTTGSVYVLS
jgi:hypothetical protein